jgi:uncharacterized protein (UPF0276 family)
MLAGPLPAPLGVGCVALPSQLEALAAVHDLLDVVEVSPELMAREVVEPASGKRRLRLDRAVLGSVLAAVRGLPVVVHGLELSIGSAAGWNQGALDLVDDLSRHVDHPWHSEHLGFLSALDAGGSERSAGVPLPLPFTAEAAAMVAARADLVSGRTGRPFLLENAACYLPDLPADPGWDEARFLVELCDRSSCHLLLDLFNLYVNCVNFGSDPFEVLDRLPLDRVVEAHVAGGALHRGFLLDSHSARVPGPVWDLLDVVLDRAPNLAAVVFEVLDDPLAEMGPRAYRSEVEELRARWERARCLSTEAR